MKSAATRLDDSHGKGIAPEKTVIIVTPSQKQNSKGETWQAFIKEQTEHIV